MTRRAQPTRERAARPRRRACAAHRLSRESRATRSGSERRSPRRFLAFTRETFCLLVAAECIGDSGVRVRKRREVTLLMDLLKCLVRSMEIQLRLRRSPFQRNTKPHQKWTMWMYSPSVSMILLLDSIMSSASSRRPCIARSGASAARICASRWCWPAVSSNSNWSRSIALSAGAGPSNQVMISHSTISRSSNGSPARRACASACSELRRSARLTVQVMSLAVSLHARASPSSSPMLFEDTLWLCSADVEELARRNVRR